MKDTPLKMNSATESATQANTMTQLPNNARTVHRIVSTALVQTKISVFLATLLKSCLKIDVSIIVLKDTITKAKSV